MALLKFSYGPKPQNTMEREREGERETFPLQSKKIIRRSMGEEEEAGCRLTLLPRFRSSEQKTINSRIAFQITRHLGLRTG